MYKLWLGALVLALSGCITKTDVIQSDLTRNEGAYVLVYSTIEPIRRSMEDQLVSDLADRNMLAYPSYPDFPDVRTTTRDSILTAANAKRTVVVLVVNQVTADNKGVIQNPARISPNHPDLKTFYNYTESVEQNFDPEQVVLAEVNAFLIDGRKTRLWWSGTTWSFKADGAGTALRGISQTIADELQKIRASVRGS
ncbi:MAG: hypothetical protein ACR2PZ_19955 [Pseudomonadales bacterium]